MKKIVSTDKAAKAIGPYNQAIEAGNMLFLSGQIPIEPESGKIVDGGIKEQTEQVLKNIIAILSAAGYSLNDVVKTTCMLSDIENFASMNAVYEQYFTKDFPARSTFQVAALPKGALIEIEVIAIKR